MCIVRCQKNLVERKFHFVERSIGQQLQLFNDPFGQFPQGSFIGHQVALHEPQFVAPVSAPAECRGCRASSASAPRSQSSWPFLAFLHPVGLHSGISHFVSSASFSSVEGLLESPSSSASAALSITRS